MKKINLVSFFDSGMILCFSEFLNSIKRVYSDSEVNLFIGVSGDIYEKIINEYSHDKYISEIVNVDSFLEVFKNEEMLFGNITKLTYSRFFINELFKEEFESFIYLDVDILLMNKIKISHLNKKKNFAIKNMSDNKILSTRSKVFWNSFLNKRILEIQEGKTKQSALKLKKKILTKIEKGNYFNAGVLIINNPKKYFFLCKKIINDKSNLSLNFDDQTLLNFYNKKHIKVINDFKLNYKVYKDTCFTDDISIIHFLGATKRIMHRIADNWEFKLLKNEYPKLLNFTLLINEEIYESTYKNYLKNIENYIDVIYINPNLDLKQIKNKIKTQFIIFIDKKVEINLEALNLVIVPREDAIVPISIANNIINSKNRIKILEEFEFIAYPYDKILEQIENKNFVRKNILLKLLNSNVSIHTLKKNTQNIVFSSWKENK